MEVKNRRAELVGRPVMDPATTSGQRWATLTATIIWGLAVAIGFLALQLHGASPGQSGSAVEHWPTRSRIPLTRRPAHLGRGRSSSLPLHAGQRLGTHAPVDQVRGPGRGLHSHLPSRACWPRLGPDRRLARSRHHARCSSTGRSRGRRSGPLRCPDFRPCCVIRSRWATPFPRRDHGCPGPRGG